MNSGVSKVLFHVVRQFHVIHKEHGICGVLKKLDDLRGCDAHFSVIISEEDEKLYKRLGIHVSCQPRYEIKRLYHK